MLSVIIPSRNEQGYLERTIQSVLDAAEGEIEVLVVLDGWLPDPRIETGDDRVVFIHNQESIGQRQAINQAALAARGDLVMKLDAHCAVARGFDLVLARDCEYDMTMIPRMYNLDVETWEPKHRKVTDYMFIGLLDGSLRAQYYDPPTGRRYGLDNLRQPKSGRMIDETMCCMGPCFVMHAKRFWELGGCDEAHGGWGQQGVEVACKAWLSGGRLVVNKHTWFAHWFRGGGVPEGHKKGFPYRLTQQAVDRARAYSTDLWMHNKWPGQVRDFQWLLDKFNPPGWGLDKKETKEMAIIDQAVRKQYYRHMISGGKMPRWLGVPVVKYPNDLLLYQQAIFANRPDLIIETGTYQGGSALFFASIFDLLGHGEVVTIDVNHDRELPSHPRITYLTGRSTSSETMARVRELAAGKQVMVVLDSNHHRRHVKRELSRYSDIVSPGQFLVVEDTNYSEIGKKNGPDEAVEWFLARSGKLRREPVEEQFILTLNPGGWLRRV